MRLLLILMFLAGTAHAQVAERDVLVVGGVERAHYLHVPATNKPPLIVALHGLGGNAANLRFGLGLTERAAAAGFAVVYPQGIRLPGGSRHWNAGFDYMEVDDLSYLTTLIRTLQDRHDLGRKVFVLGISMGGYMAYYLACQGVELAAIASVSGRMGGRDWRNCPSEDLPSLLHIHGVQDSYILYETMLDHQSNWGGAPSVPKIVAFWADRIGASAVEAPSREGIEALRFETGSSVVQMIALENMGHDWPAEATYGFSAVEELLEFFKEARRDAQETVIRIPRPQPRPLRQMPQDPT